MRILMNLQFAFFEGPIDGSSKKAEFNWLVLCTLFFQIKDITTSYLSNQRYRYELPRKLNRFL